MKEYEKDYTPIEMMLIAAGREIKDDEIVFAGVYWPILVAFFAKRTHAPNTKLVFEAGIIRDSLPTRMASSTTDPGLVHGAILCRDSIVTLGLLQSGFIDVGVLSASIVDRYGNINTTCIGDYRKPKVRLPGGGGATELASLAKRVVIVVDRHEKRRFPEKVDFITSPGYLEGSNSREKAGLRPGTGPSALITPLGVFRFDSEKREMYLDSYHPGATVEEIKRNMGWDLKVSANVHETEPPTKEEVRVAKQILQEAREMYYVIP